MNSRGLSGYFNTREISNKQLFTALLVTAGLMNSHGLSGYFNMHEISNKQTVLIGLDLSKEKRPYWFNTVVYEEIWLQQHKG